MGRLRVQEEKEAWIEGGEERGEGEKGGECKRPEGAAALHNQIPRWCSRMRSTLSAVRRKSRGGGVRDPAGTRALRKMHSLLSLPSLRPVTRPPLAQVLQPNPSRNSGNKPETPTRFFDWWPPRNFNRDVSRGENRLGEIFHSKGPRNFRRVWGFYFLVGEEGCYVEGNEEWCLV